jgi:hypothetical protein
MSSIRVAVYGQHAVIQEQRINGSRALSTWARNTGATLCPRYSPSGRRLTHRATYVWEARDANGKKYAGGTVSTIRAGK